MKNRIASLAVGLASDCDRPERDVQEIMRANLSGASTLPFVGFVTHDGKWVGGFSGYKDASAFLRVLEGAEDTPYLKASKAVQRKLAGLAAKAEKAAGKGDWKSVMKAAQAAAKTTGRCPERQELAKFEKSARDWATSQLDTAVQTARNGGDLTPARDALNAVRKQFSGQPEGAEANTGLKALKRLQRILDVEAGGSPPAGLRAKVARDYEGTRWATIFLPPQEDNG